MVADPARRDLLINPAQSEGRTCVSDYERSCAPSSFISSSPLTMANRNSQDNDVYIREALPTELETITIARLLTRAFAQDPSMNWFGSVSRLVPVPSTDDMKATPLWRLPKELELLYYFMNAYIVSVHLSGGHITVAVRPEPDGSEKIVSVAAWFPPGAKIDNPIIILKSKQHRTLFGSWRRPGGWGLRGLKVYTCHMSASFF